MKIIYSSLSTIKLLSLSKIKCYLPDWIIFHTRIGTKKKWQSVTRIRLMFTLLPRLLTQFDRWLLCNNLVSRMFFNLIFASFDVCYFRLRSTCFYLCSCSTVTAAPKWFAAEFFVAWKQKSVLSRRHGLECIEILHLCESTLSIYVSYMYL